MITGAEKTLLRQAYSDICRGYSIDKFKTNRVFIKHFNVCDQIEIDAHYNRMFDEAILKKINTEREKLKILDKKGIWTKKDEFNLEQEKSYLKNLQKTRSKIALKLQLEQIDKQIKEAEDKINKLIYKRNNFIDVTAEKIAAHKNQFEYVRLGFFLDDTFRLPLFTEEDIYYMDEDDSDKAMSLFVSYYNKIDISVIKKIAIQPFFSTSFYLCGDNVLDFFGKPAANLTTHQINLLSYGQYFKSIISQNNIPDDLLDSPDELEAYVNRSKNAKTMIEKASVSKNGRVGIVGATAEDFEILGVQDNTDKMRGIAQKQYKTGRDGAQDLGFTYND